jgi:hypothetical protein
VGKTLYNCDADEVEGITEAWMEAFTALQRVTGESN